MPGTTVLPTDFSVIKPGQIPVGAFLYGFDKNNSNLLSKMDSSLVLTVIESHITNFVMPVTYAQLAVLQAGSLFIPGQEYLITDFKTTHFIVDSNNIQDVASIITGTLEPIIVTAITVNKLDKEAKSTLFPQDKIYYDMLPANWLDDLSFSDISGPTIITGFKGVIYFRHDTLLDNYTGYDFRNCKFRRWKTNTTAWSAIVFVSGSIVNNAGVIYIAIHDSTGANVPGVANDIWAQLLDLTIFEYYCGNSTAQNGITASGVFADFKTFAENGTTGTYDLSVRSTHIEAFKDRANGSYISGCGTILSNNVFVLFDGGAYNMVQNVINTGSYGNTILTAGFSNNVIDTSFRNNVIATGLAETAIDSFCAFNVISDGFLKNTIGNSFLNNYISTSCTTNVIGNEFDSNIIGNTFTNNSIGNGFLSNKLSTNYKNNRIGAICQGNSILSGFSGNTAGYSFFNNSIGIDCLYNNFNNTFYNNVADNNFQRNHMAGDIHDVNWVGATLVYTLYSKYISNRVDGTQVLQFIDNINVLNIVVATT